MEIKDIIQHTEQEEESTPVYMPSSSEKKRAVLMYLFIGIVVYLSKKDVNVFEYYHLKQATGRRILFLFTLVVSIVLLFIPVIKILAALLLIVFIAAWGIWIKQARDWFYDYWSKTNILSLFSWVGNRFLNLFEIEMRHVDPEIETTNTAKDSKSNPIDEDLQKDEDTDDNKK